MGQYHLGRKWRRRLETQPYFTQTLLRVLLCSIAPNYPLELHALFLGICWPLLHAAPPLPVSSSVTPRPLTSLKAMLHFHWVCFKAQRATWTTESSSGKGKNGRRARWSTLVGEWNTSVLCVAPMRKDSAYTVLGYFSWVHKVGWGHPERGKMTHGLLLLRDLRGERGTKFPHSESHPGIGTFKMTINGF